jgi:integrase
MVRHYKGPLMGLGQAVWVSLALQGWNERGPNRGRRYDQRWTGHTGFRRAAQDEIDARGLRVVRRIAAARGDWNFLTHSPAHGVAQLPEASKIPDALSDDQLESLLAELPEYARLMVTILVYSGLRRSELHRITWGDIDFENNEIAIRTTKNSEFRVIPMHAQVRAVFRGLRPGRSWPKTQSGQNRITIVWPDSSTPSAVVIPPIDIKKSIISAAKRAGIGHVYPHMLRHTFATKMRDSGVPLDRIQEFLGHKTMAMVLRYAKARPEQLQEAIKKI